jgi:GNAT superfamily N-acetyltransferase
MEIRVAAAEDAAGIARVQVATWRAAYAGLIAAPVLDGLSVPAAASRWSERLGRPGHGIWVAGPPGEVAGFVCAGPARDEDGPQGEVYALYVLAGRQRAGLGSALLAAATGWLRDEHGARDLALWVLGTNAAGRAFYAATGWSHDGTERDLDVGGDVVREVRYRMSFQN